MNPQLAAIAANQHGLFTNAQARRCGYTNDDARYLARTGVWVRIRRGIYAEAEFVSGLDPLRAHELKVDAVLLAVSSEVFVSHFSAAVVHGMQLQHPDLSIVHVTRVSCRSARDEAGVRFHAATAESWERTTVGGRPVTTLPRTAVDVARSCDFEDGVIAIDSALRCGARLADIQEAMRLSSNWRGARTAGMAVACADPGSGSVGETRCRLTLIRQGLPVPETQVAFHDADGLIGIVDFYYRGERTVAEFDGKVKYRVSADLTGDQATEVLWREKQREDRLRRLGLQVVRVTWSDLYRPEALAARVRAAFELARIGGRLAG